MKANITFPDDTPCILKCSLDKEKVCTGCFRHIDEITAWSKATAQERDIILKKARLRKST